MLIICNVVSAELWFSYWIRIGTKMAPIVSSSVSFTLGIIFSIIYLYYFSEKKCSKFFIYILLECLAIALLYYSLTLTELKIIGFIANCVNILNFISPAQRIVRVCREKNYSLIPIVTTVLGCVTSFGWLVFGILINDYNVMIPNIISVLIALFNTLIWCYFYCTTKRKKESKVKKNEVDLNSISNLSENISNNISQINEILKGNGDKMTIGQDDLLKNIPVEFLKNLCAKVAVNK